MTLPAAADWKDIGTSALCLALNATGAALMTTGRVLMFCGLQLRVIGARFGPQ